MMTKQAELKKQAYASNLKSRALSILIYLIDRSNQNLTCFPAIPTMARELHIGVSTVKRALHELVDAGYIQKDARYREKNRGQTSNLYTLMLVVNTPEPENDHNLKQEDYIDIDTDTAIVKTEQKAEHISFATLTAEKQEPSQYTEEVSENTAAAPSTEKRAVRPPVQMPLWKIGSTSAVLCRIKEIAGQFLPCDSRSFLWTGVESNLNPP